MSAVDKALRHIEQLIAARRPKPAKRDLNRRGKNISAKPRVVSARAGHKSLEAYNPEPAPVDQVKLAEQQATFAPPPTPPEMPGPISPAVFAPPITPPPEPMPFVAPLPVTRPHWAAAFEAAPSPAIRAPEVASSTTGLVARGSCKAVDAKTGRVCRLPAHAGEEHAHERGRFHLVAKPGQVVGVRRAIDDAAWNTADSGGLHG